MSKMYVVTAVDYNDSADGKARAIKATLSPYEANDALKEDIGHYIETFKANGIELKEEGLAVWKDDHNGCEWNVEDVKVDIPLTPLQFTTLNGIGAAILRKEDDYFSYDSLSEEEDKYLLEWLKENGVEIDKANTKMIYKK